MTQKTICFPFVLDPTGGSFISTKLLIENLEDGFDCTLIFGTDSSGASKARKSGLNTKILPLRESLLQRITRNTSIFNEIIMGILLLPYMAKACYFLRKESVDVVHVNDGLTAVIWGIAAKTMGIPVIWHVRSERSNEWDNIRLRLCDHLIFVAESNKRRFSEQALYDIEISVVHNGVDLSLFHPKKTKLLHKELDLCADVPIVGFVGNLVSRKRPMLFVNSALESLERNSNVHFVLVGGDHGHYENKISKAAQSRGFGDKIHVLGYRSDVDEIIPSLDLLVLTSTQHGEAFPRVPLEAMASGTPVITTDTAGVSEAVVDGQTGIVMDTNPSPMEISSEILNLLQSDERIAYYRSNAISHVQSNFSIEEQTREITQVYHQIL